MCLAARHGAPHFSVHLGFLGWARCPLVVEKNTLFGILLLTDTNTASSHFLAKSSLQSSTKLLTNRKYWLAPCFSSWCFEKHHKSCIDSEDLNCFFF